MAAAPPKPKARSLSRSASRLVVRLGPTDGAAPTDQDEVDYLHPTRIERCAGGSRVSAAEFDYDLGRVNQHVINTLCPKGVTRQIEVREVDVFGDLKRILFWGKLAAQPISIDESEKVRFVARIDKHLFGEPLGRIPFFKAGTGGTILQLDRPLVFNPEIDEVVLGNKSSEVWTLRNNAPVLFDVASINNLAARTFHGQTLTKWTIYEAAHLLCWLCNPNEAYIQNPTGADAFIDLQALDPDASLLRNVPVARDRYLPQLLDELLTPYGAGWTVDLSTDPNTNETVRKIRFFRRNHGTKRELFLQKPGERLEPAKSNTAQLAINYDVSNLHNKIVGRTSRKQREGTFELAFAWPESEDALDRDQLEKDPTLSQAHPHAFRKLVLDTSGAYIGLRPEHVTYYDLTSFFDGDATLPTCRKFLPCLSRVKDDQSSSDKLESRSIYAEWYDPGISAWQRIDWGFSNLQLECGIWFDSIPLDFYNAIQAYGTAVKVRVTATIEGDLCTYATADRIDESPNGDEIVLPLNLGDKFHDKDVVSGSKFYPELATADRADDYIQLLAYVGKIRSIEDSAELSCSAVLEGIDHPEYQIGDLITSVNGRNLKLNRNNAALLSPEKYLQIVGYTYNLPPGEDSKPQTELLLESFDEERI